MFVCLETLRFIRWRFNLKRIEYLILILNWQIWPISFNLFAGGGEAYFFVLIHVDSQILIYLKYHVNLNMFFLLPFISVILSFLLCDVKLQNSDSFQEHVMVRLNFVLCVKTGASIISEMTFIQYCQIHSWMDQKSKSWSLLFLFYACSSHLVVVHFISCIRICCSENHIY